MRQSRISSKVVEALSLLSEAARLWVIGRSKLEIARLRRVEQGTARWPRTAATAKQRALRIAAICARI
jgi:hypothetical protein